MFSEEFWNQVEESIDLGYIKVQKHPTEFLWIYNYTQNAMFDGYWNESTMTCRGLIVDENKNVIARPMRKFFTKEQCESFGIKISYEEEFEVTDKVDGSLGVLYFIRNEPFLATRGLFNSEQAIEANKILKEKYSDIKFDPDFTYLFEILYPNNRIVVNYGDKRDLILLAIIETFTGREVPISCAPEGLNLVKRYHGIKDFNKVLDNFQKFSGTEFEGLVIKFKSGFRVKVKTEDYKRLHKILTGINEKRIWECLSSGQGLKEILDVVPDEFYKWIKQVEADLYMSYNATEGVAKIMFKSAMEYVEALNDKENHRKNFANYVLKCESKIYNSICFQMYSGMNYSKLIWSSLEPKGDQKFKSLQELI